MNNRLLFDYSLPQVLVYSDASATGCGAWTVVCGTMKFHQNWDSIEMSKISTWRELKGVALAIYAFANSFIGKQVKMFTDNKGVVSIVKNGSMNRELQDISIEHFEFCRLHNIRLEIQWVPREDTIQADTLSREEDFDDWGVSR